MKNYSEMAKTFTSFTFCPSGLPCFARSRPPASRFTSFRSAVVELTTTSLVLYISLFRYEKGTRKGCLSYRNSEIRTHDLLLPKQALYQAELYSGLVGTIIDKK